jgi:tetratricopeptide (TPR) repeat protein
MADELLELVDEAIRRTEDGDPAEAVAPAERALALAAHDPRLGARAAAHRAMGRVRFGLGEFPKAIVEADIARDLDLAADPDGAGVGEDDNLGGAAALALGDAEIGLQRVRAALACLERVNGPDHHLTIQALNNLAAATARSGDEPGAEAIGRDALERAERALGDHRQTAVILNSLSVRAGRAGRLGESIELADRGLAVAERTLGPGHPLASTLAANAAIHRAKAGDPRAEELIREAVARHEAAYGPSHPNLAFVLIALSDVTTDLRTKRLAAARAAYIRLRALGPTAKPTLDALARAAARLAPGDPGETATPEAMAVYQAWATLDPARVPVKLPFAGAPSTDEVASRLDMALTRILTDVPLRDDVREAVGREYGAADEAVATGDYAAALAALDRAIGRIEDAKGSDAAHLLEPLRRVDAVARAAGDGERRFEAMRRIADVTEGAYGRSHPLSALAIQRYAELERYELGDVTAQTADRAVDAVRAAFGERSPLLEKAEHVWRGNPRPVRLIPLSRRRREELDRIVAIPAHAGDPLREVDAVDWPALHHGLGPARDVPLELRLLRSSDPDVRSDAVARLASATLHEGSIYPATLAIVPFLVRLALDPATSDRAAIVGLLGYVAAKAASPASSEVDLAHAILTEIHGHAPSLLAVDDGTRALADAVAKIRETVRHAPRPIRRLN